MSLLRRATPARGARPCALAGLVAVIWLALIADPALEPRPQRIDLMLLAGDENVVPLSMLRAFLADGARHDLGTELSDYREIPSVQEILLVSSEARRVAVWHREGTCWIVETLTGDAEVGLVTIDEPIPLSSIYDNVAA